MRVAVLGLWHLGTVTAACLAEAGHDVVGCDDDVASLRAGVPPVAEPGLEALVGHGLATGHLRFTDDPAEALADAEVVWVAYDTPVDDDDVADVQAVTSRVRAAAAHLAPGAVVLVSSQVPAGTTAALAASIGRDDVSFAYSPENLRLGRALEAFREPDRIVVGVRDPAARERIGALLAPFTETIVWMGVESAEMTKHALNAFLATSVTFINEVAGLCEVVGADAREVEAGLKSEPRIGLRAYLGPGAAFAGGTLARDVTFLTDMGARLGRPTDLLSGVRAGNDAHKTWALRALQAALGALDGVTVAVWGLTYKAGTDTLRRSSSVELCAALAAAGATVRAHDPASPDTAGTGIALSASALEAAAGADALVVATEWPEYRAIAASDVLDALGGRLVVDANGFLAAGLGAQPGVRYVSVGRAAGA